MKTLITVMAACALYGCAGMDKAHDECYKMGAIMPADMAACSAIVWLRGQN